MKVLTIGGAMIDTIAIIADNRIERMTMLNADSSFLLLEEGRKTEAVEISTHARSSLDKSLKSCFCQKTSSGAVAVDKSTECRRVALASQSWPYSPSGLSVMQ